MASVSLVGAGVPGVVFYRVKRVKGHCYLVKEWWDPVLKKKITRSIGSCETIDRVMKEWKAARKKSKRGNGGSAPVWRRGRDLNPGHGLDRPAPMAKAINTVSPASISPPSDARLELWETWCQERGTSPETCAKYAGYLERPLDPSNRWSVKAYKLYLKWLCEEHGHQESCQAYKRLKTPQAKPDLKVPSLEEILDSIRRAGPYSIVYMILLESGLRLVEAVNLIREYPRLECTKLDGFQRCLLGYARGKKQALWAYHITPIEKADNLSDRRVTSYAEKYKLVPPKYIRKFVATQMVTLGIPPHVVDFIQGRAPRGVLLQHYAPLLGLADREYRKYAEWLRQVYDELGLRG